MIAVLEPVFANRNHAAVNAGLLQAILLASPGEPVTLVAAPEHRAALMEIVGPATTAPGRLDIHVSPVGTASAARIASQLRAMQAAIRTVRPHTLVCLSTTPETFFAWRLLSLRSRDVRAVVVLHGNLYDAVGWRSRDPRHRLFDSCSSLFVGRHSPVQFVVLEAAIRDAAVARGLLPAERTHVWPHPINDREARAPRERLESSRVGIAFLGAAKRSKGFGDFLALMKHLRQQDPHGFELSLIGPKYDEFTAAETAGLMLPDEMLPRDDYLSRLRNVDYACVFLQRDIYALTASGSLLDCVACTTPIIATQTAAIEHMSEAGPIGFVADTAEALTEIVLDRRRLRDRPSHLRFQHHLATLQQTRCPAAIACAVRRTLHDGPGCR